VGSTDERAGELERQIVLSQYLTAIQCAGSLPPQETGLTCNSWFGKYHLEMHWWHAHFAAWGRTALLDSPSPIGELLIWQQPHPISLRECHLTEPSPERLRRYASWRWGSSEVARAGHAP